MTFSTDTAISYFQKGQSKILICELKNSLDPMGWIDANKEEVERSLFLHGGVLLRKLGLKGVSEFNHFVQKLSPTLLDYMYRSTPRTRLGGKVYTATEYPADRVIPLHNENAYSRSWPTRLYFFSVLVAAEGGQTPIADSRRIYEKIPLSIREKFERLGILYVRNYRKGIDLSWQDVFQTESREVVEKYCKQHNIEFAWDQGLSELTTRQVCQASVVHPQTQEKVWFNQAHLFHVSALDDTTRQSLLKEYGERYLPRNAYYGDGSPLEEDSLQCIRETIDQEKIVFNWQKGDIMILDNLLMAHGREPYVGERKVAVAMA